MYFWVPHVDEHPTLLSKKYGKPRPQGAVDLGRSRSINSRGIANAHTEKNKDMSSTLVS